MARVHLEPKQLVNQATVSGITSPGKGSLHLFGAGLSSADRRVLASVSKVSRHLAWMSFLLPCEFHLTSPPLDIFWVTQEHKGTNLKMYNKYLREKQILYFHMHLKFSKYTYLTISASIRMLSFLDMWRKILLIMGVVSERK